MKLNENESTLPARYIILNPADIQMGGNTHITSKDEVKTINISL